MIIEVTQKDIDQGVRLKCSQCPIALAVSRRVGAEVVIVNYLRVKATVNGIALEGFLPIAATRFSQSFDGVAAEPVAIKPFNFHLYFQRQ